MKQRNYFVVPALVFYGIFRCVALLYPTVLFSNKNSTPQQSNAGCIKVLGNGTHCIVRFLHVLRKRHAVFMLIMFCMCMPLFLLAAGKPLQYDSSSIEHRHFSESSINTYKNDSDYDYERKIVKSESLLSRFWRWFWDLYDSFTSTPAGRTIKDIFLWTLFIGALAFFVYKVYTTNRVALFSANPQLKNTYIIGEENIHEINFDPAIARAANEGNYRLAVRLYYLKNLKLLSDKELIDWQLNKTNTDYIRELAHTNYYQGFQKNTRAFEYAWYGNMPVSKEGYEIIKDQFITFQNSI